MGCLIATVFICNHFLFMQETLKRAARASQAENNCPIPFLHCINDNNIDPKSNRSCYFLMRFDQMVITLPNNATNSTTSLTIFQGNTSETTLTNVNGCDFDDSHPELK